MVSIVRKMKNNSRAIFLLEAKVIHFCNLEGITRKLSILLNFFPVILWVFRNNIWWHQILWSFKHQQFEKLIWLYTNQKIIQYWSLSTYCTCFWVRGCGMKNDDVITQVHQKWSYPKCGKLYINRKIITYSSFFY